MTGFSVNSLSFTDKSLEESEDYFYNNPGNGLFMVADAMGGRGYAGQESSWYAVESIRKNIEAAIAGEDVDISRVISEAVRSANESLFNMGEEDGRSHGTTLILSLLNRDELFFTGIGDSRLYMLEGGQLRQLSVDQKHLMNRFSSHTVDPGWGELGDMILSEDFMPSEFLGKKKYVTVDVKKVKVKPGTRLLQATDGLTDLATAKEISTALNMDNLEDCRSYLASLVKSPRDAALLLVDNFEKAYNSGVALNRKKDPNFRINNIRDIIFNKYSGHPSVQDFMRQWNGAENKDRLGIIVENLQVGFIHRKYVEETSSYIANKDDAVFNIVEIGLEKIVEDEKPGNPLPDRTKEMPELAGTYQNRIAQMQEYFGSDPKATALDILTGSYRDGNGKRTWLWEDRVKKLQEWYQSEDVMMDSDEIGRIMDVLKANKYVVSKHKEVLGEIERLLKNQEIHYEESPKQVQDPSGIAGKGDDEDNHHEPGSTVEYAGNRKDQALELGLKLNAAVHNNTNLIKSAAQKAVGSYLGSDKLGACVSRVVQDGLPELSRTFRDGIGPDIWNKDDLPGGVLRISPEIVKKYNIRKNDV